MSNVKRSVASEDRRVWHISMIASKGNRFGRLSGACQLGKVVVRGSSDRRYRAEKERRPVHASGQSTVVLLWSITNEGTAANMIMIVQQEDTVHAITGRAEVKLSWRDTLYCVHCGVTTMSAKYQEQDDNFETRHSGAQSCVSIQQQTTDYWAKTKLNTSNHDHFLPQTKLFHL